MNLKDDETSLAEQLLRQHMREANGPAGVYRLGSDRGQQIVLSAMKAYAREFHRTVTLAQKDTQNG